MKFKVLRAGTMKEMEDILSSFVVGKNVVSIHFALEHTFPATYYYVLVIYEEPD